jgi:phosphoglycerate dehydrogenase-like enzyme
MRRGLALVPGVRFIQQFAVGYDNLDLGAIRAAGIGAANNPGFNSSSVAEHTIMLMLVLLHRFVAAHDTTRTGGFPTAAFIGANQERLTGFKSRVMYFARHRLDQAAETQLGVEYTPFNDLLSGASIVSLHVPSTAETRHFIGSAELARMQPNAFLINTSRGDVLDGAALRQSVQDGRLAGAGLDVVDDELREVNPFSDLPQVVVTPHTAGISRSSMPRALRLAVANIDRYLRGEPVLNLLTDLATGWRR